MFRGLSFSPISVVATLLVIPFVCCQFYWKQDSMFNNFKANDTDSISHDVNASTAIVCAFACSDQKWCNSFFFNSVSGLCSLQSLIFSWHQKLSVVLSPSERYYYLYNVQLPTSCDDVKEYDRESGIHTLFLGDNRNVRVYCDQTTGDGGWVVIQRRQDGSVDFYRNWSQYVAGFGSLSTEFWIGLDNLYYLTKTQNYKLRVDLMDFDGSRAYAEYENFGISSTSDNYRLYVEGYSGTAGDSLSYHHLMQFTTYDSDNDENNNGGNCAIGWHGAWWYKLCHKSNLNGLYKFDSAVGADGVTWFYWRNEHRSLKRVEMKIKRKGS